MLTRLRCREKRGARAHLFHSLFFVSVFEILFYTCILLLCLLVKAKAMLPLVVLEVTFQVLPSSNVGATCVHSDCGHNNARPQGYERFVNGTKYYYYFKNKS